MSDIITNREKLRLRATKWRSKNREKHRASVRAWRDANPEKAREKDRRSRERRTAKQRALREARSNLQLTCVPCNLAKSARHPVEFAQSLGLLL